MSKLKLAAADAEDLEVISARLQDAVALFLATGGGWSAEARR